MDGVILLNKPKGVTSHDCVNKIRRLLKTKKVGHTGTLDPEATGLLPICIGKATKISSLLTGQSKEYLAEISLGKSTTTEDQTGETLSTSHVDKELTIQECNQILKTYVGTITQIPPMYSAIKVNGKKLYEYAREGIEVERPKREVQIQSIDMLSKEINWYNSNDVRFEFLVHCSSGTYIRTLCVDIGHSLGYPAHMSELLRTKVGDFSLSESLTLDELESIVNEDKKIPIISMANALNMPSIVASDEVVDRYWHGQVLNVPEGVEGQSMFKVLSSDGNLIAVYKPHPSKDGKVKPFRVFQ